MVNRGQMVVELGELRREFKVECVRRGLTMRGCLELLIRRWLMECKVEVGFGDGVEGDGVKVSPVMEEPIEKGP